MIISGNKKKSLNKNQEIKEEQFLNRKRKADDDQEKNSYVIMRKDYLKKDISEFSREINISSLKTSIIDNSNLKSSSNNRDRLKKINEYLLSDDEKYQEFAGNPGSQLNPIRIDSLSEDGETIERLDSPLLKIMQNDDQVEQEYINRMGCAKVERILKSKPINEEYNHMSNKFDNFSSNVNLDSNQNKFAKKKLSSFENQSDFIGFPSKAETVVKSVKKSVNSYYDEEMEFPWLTEKSQNERGMLKLHYEILEFYEFIRPNSKEDLLREKTIKVVKDLISANFPELKVKKFGSFPNKIHLPDSDIDIVVLCESKDGQPVDQLKLLKKITQKLIDNHLVDFIKIIEARVPIIRATLKETKINMDISANRKNGYEAKKVIKRVLEDFPHMRPLMYVLKYFLRQRKLNESYTGGISSFLLFNLLFAYIQYTTKENDSSIKTLGHLLTGFLQFYSFVFNYEEVGISIRHGGFFYKKSESPLNDPKRQCLLSVENFQELDQDVGKASFKFRKVLDCFKYARDALFYPSQSPIKSYIGSFLNVDNFIIERYQKNKEYQEELNK